MGRNVPRAGGGYGTPSALALGLRKPVQETLQTTARIEYRNLGAALEADAEARAARFADDVKRGLGEAEPRTPLKEAMWEDDPELAAWKKQELERARELAQVRDPNRLAQEVRWWSRAGRPPPLPLRPDALSTRASW